MQEPGANALRLIPCSQPRAIYKRISDSRSSVLRSTHIINNKLAGQSPWNGSQSGERRFRRIRTCLLRCWTTIPYGNTVQKVAGKLRVPIAQARKGLQHTACAYDFELLDSVIPYSSVLPF